MARHGYVPDVLRQGSFTVAEARETGITRKQLRGSEWRRVSYDRYRWVGTELTERLCLAAIATGLPSGSVFAGLTAA
ncbi:MAG: hypothetical protein ACREQM_22880 [Candidatus Dormibacteraceae bacterium]